MDRDYAKEIMAILEKHPEGLSIDEVSNILKTTRTTAARYLDSLVASGKIIRREVGIAKLHYMPKDGENIEKR